MKKKLMFTYIFIIAFVCLTTGYFSITTSQIYLENQIKDNLTKDLELLSDILIRENTKNLSDFVDYYYKQTDLRITIIDYSGTVIADSDKTKDKSDNHSQREEFKEALNGNIGFSKRYSETIGEFYLYCAKSITYNSNSVVFRLSTPLSKVQQLKTDILNSTAGSIFISIAIAIIIAFIFSKIFSDSIKELTVAVEDVSKGNYGKMIYVHSDDEVGKLTSAFNTMSRELKYSVNQLRDKNIKLESILNSITNGLIAIDDSYNIIMINQLAYKLFNIKQKDIKGRIVHEVIRDSNVFDILDNCYKKNQPIVNEIDYNEKILRISANPIQNKNVESKGIVLLIEDITKIRKLEKMRSEFVSNVTHELKTPLTSIKGFIDTLKQGAIDDTNVAKKFLNIIDVEAERLYNLIQEILTLSEIETRTNDINIVKFSILEIVDALKEILQPLADKKNLELKINITEKSTDLFCNKERILQLLINLIDNAIKYTESGIVEVNFKTDFNILIINVKDTGIGIPKDSIERIFERFYRVDKGRSRKIGGTGLGLAVVKHIVILYKGKIEVQSNLGKGSTFKVSLPIVYKNNL